MDSCCLKYLLKRFSFPEQADQSLRKRKQRGGGGEWNSELKTITNSCINTQHRNLYAFSILSVCNYKNRKCTSTWWVVLVKFFDVILSRIPLNALRCFETFSSMSSKWQLKFVYIACQILLTAKTINIFLYFPNNYWETTELWLV